MRKRLSGYAVFALFFLIVVKAVRFFARQTGSGMDCFFLMAFAAFVVFSVAALVEGVRQFRKAGQRRILYLSILASVYRGTHRFLALWPRPWLRYPPCFPARKAASSALPEARPQAENSKGPSRRPRRSQHAFGHALMAMFPLYTDASGSCCRFLFANGLSRVCDAQAGGGAAGASALTQL